MQEQPVVLWRPKGRTTMDAFADFAAARTGRTFPDYAALHEWSVTDLDGFWSTAADYLGVHFDTPPTATLGSRAMPGTEWFPGATLNYAAQSLGFDRDDTDIAVVFAREDGLTREVTYLELRELVARARVGLQRHGVAKGDRVVAVAPNCVETLAMFLATASLGAIWSSCSPDFGPKAVQDRFLQLDPKVLFAVDGYLYGGKRIDIRPTVEVLRDALPSLEAAVLLPYLDEGAMVEGVETWLEFTSALSPLAFEPVPFDHPLWVLFSSGTTGLPKGIVQGHGGIVLEHMKAWALHWAVEPGDRIFWFTTTGWMMWNFLISGLQVGATIVLYDGSPGYPDMDAMWALAAQQRVKVFGTSAPFIHACMKAGISPARQFDLSAIKVLGSTGAPLSPEGFGWIADEVGRDVQIASFSGGTDVCTGFLGSSPNVPVWRGELSCAALGADVRAYDEAGRDLLDAVGELVITQPLPSMPVAFWNDPDGTKLHDAYFDMYEGVWRHGDWVRRTPRGSYVIYGRSDSTLNRGGVRMGTADFYAVVEAFPEVADSLVIDTTALGATVEGELLCFVVLTADADLAGVEPALRKALRTQLSPRHVPDRFIPVETVPRTLNGKKCEVPVKKILAGADPDTAVSRDALLVPGALDFFVSIASR